MTAIRRPRLLVLAPLACSVLCLTLGAVAATPGSGRTSTTRPPPKVLPVVLPAVHAMRGAAIARWRTRQGAVVQLNHGCNEWSGYTDGVLARRRRGRLMTWGFPAGPVLEVGAWLLVESRIQVGSDGSEAPLKLPRGARGVIHDTTGALWVSRVVAIHQRTGRQRKAPWDTYVAVRPSSERRVILRRDPRPRRPGQARAGRWLRWDVGTGRLRRLRGRPGRAPSARPVGRRRVNLVTEAATWRTYRNRPVHVGATPSRRKPALPRVGGCGVSGAWLGLGALFTDEGLFRWSTSRRR